MRMNITALLRAGRMKHTEERLAVIADDVRRAYEEAIRENRPSWWSRMALSTSQGGGGGILTRKIPGGLRVYYANQGRYDYLAVIEKGRGRYSIRDALLRSRRVRNGKNGPYIIVPLSQPAPDQDSPVLKRTGVFRDEEGKPRLGYRTLRGGSSRIVSMAQGPVKGGGMQTSEMRFVTVSRRSRDWLYPEMRPNPISQRLQQSVDQRLPRDQALREAIRLDVEEVIRRVSG